MAASEKPDMILMDLTLPDIRGEEATRRIKADQQRVVFRLLPSRRMPWQATGRRLSLQAAMTSIPSRSSCNVCSKKLRL